MISSRWIIGLLLVGASAQAEVKTWTNALGRSFQAEFVRRDGENVIFALENGRTFSTPWKDICAADQALLLQSRESAAAPETTARVKPPNFGHAWPREIRVDGASQSRVVSEDAKKGQYIYESPHYRFTCDVRLVSDVLRNFAMMFETTYQYATAVPLGLDGGSLKQGRLEILLFGTMEGYVRAGGRVNSAACFVPGTGKVLAPVQSLGLRRTSTGFSLDTTGTNDVLIHELTHQLTPRSYMGASLRNGWLTEGLAEYIAQTPYSWGYFRSDAQGNAVLAYVTAYGEDRRAGRALGTKLKAPRLRQFMQMDYEAFAGENANFNYGFALLLTHYFLHMEGGGRSMRMTEYLKGLRAGRDGEASLAPLLGGGSYEKLEAEVADAWRRKGVEIVFGP